MSAKKFILQKSKEANITMGELSLIAGYKHLPSFYKALNKARSMRFDRIASIAKFLNVPICEMINIINPIKK